MAAFSIKYANSSESRVNIANDPTSFIWNLVILFFFSIQFCLRITNHEMCINSKLVYMQWEYCELYFWMELQFATTKVIHHGKNGHCTTNVFNLPANNLLLLAIDAWTAQVHLVQCFLTYSTEEVIVCSQVLFILLLYFAQSWDLFFTYWLLYCPLLSFAVACNILLCVFYAPYVPFSLYSIR